MKSRDKDLQLRGREPEARPSTVAIARRPDLSIAVFGPEGARARENLWLPHFAAAARHESLEITGGYQLGEAVLGEHHVPYGWR